MKTVKVDVAVIGAGTAGLTARRTAEKAGASTVIVDPGPFGTTCARTGCMPSKLLIAAAGMAEASRRSEELGVFNRVVVRGRDVMGRVRRERDRFVAFVMDDIHDLKNKKLLIEEKAEFAEAGVLRAGSWRIEAGSIVVASGSEPFIPPVYRELGNMVMTHENFFDMEDLPGSVLVVGAGLVGLELGQALHRLGVRVRVLGLQGRVGFLKDSGLKDEAAGILNREFPVHTEHKLLEVRKHHTGVRIRFEDERGDVREDVFERVLCAAGRKPRWSGLCPEKAGISLNEKGLPEICTRTLHIKDTRVFAAGDVNGIRPVLHEASLEGRVAGNNAASFPEMRGVNPKTALNILFTDPQMASVGDVPEPADSGIAVAGVSFASQGRSRIMNENRGRILLYADRATGTLRAAELVTPRAEHLAHEIAWMIGSNAGVGELLSRPFYHPTFEEGLHTALENLHEALFRNGQHGDA
ncbi:MAG: dihydrolipoyl dehydrogenase [Candidatus Omnitrophica bacterium]|nr:dihydrolipoyl dehydrogenase [Candidatus Omnitrophota bacterium]